MNTVDIDLYVVTNLTEVVAKLQTSILGVKNQVIRKEITQQIQYQPKRNFGFDGKWGTREPRPLIPMNPTNMVEEEEYLWCNHCNDFHAKETFLKFRRWIKESMFEHTHDQMIFILFMKMIPFVLWEEWVI
jgi:hypothetical protein